MPTEQDTVRTFAHGRFVPKRIIGKGGAGVVYQATDTHTCTDVALKVPHQSLARHRSVRTRVRNEARILAMIRHVGVPIVFDCEGGDEYPYLAIELIEGVNLAESLDNGAIPPRAATRIMRDLAKVLGEAVHGHERHIIHRDVKPDNIRLRFNGSLVLTDFGIAKVLNTDVGTGGTIVHNLTRNSGGIGTPGFVSSEQWDGDDVDERADLFSLGVTFWCILTNPMKDIEDPVLADKTRKRWKKWDVVSTEDPSLVGVPECLRPVIVGCFQGDFRNAAAFLEALADAEKSLLEDTSETFWEDLRLSGCRNQTMIPLVDPFEDIDAGLVSQDVLPPDDLQVGVDDHDLNDDEDDPMDDEIDVPPEVTRTDPAIRRQRRNKRYTRNAMTVLAAAIALVAVTWALTVKNGLQAPVPTTASASMATSTSPTLTDTVSDPIASTATVPSNSGFTQTVAGFNSALDAPPASPATPTSKKELKPTAPPKKVETAAIAKIDPSTPAPVAAAPAAPPQGEGRVRLIGKPVAAHLTSESGGGTFSIPGKVPPGLYRIGAKFAGVDVFKDFDTVQVNPDASVTIRCDADFGTCSI